jgi:hypothetical protein
VFLEARGGIEPPIEVLQTSALPLGDRAPREDGQARNPRPGARVGISGAGDGGRTRDFDLGKVALYH